MSKPYKTFPPRTPRWLQVLAVVLILVVAALMLYENAPL